MRILIFNPDTDMALGLNAESYTPKQKIREMRWRYAPLISLFAHKNEDFKILILEDTLPDDLKPFSDRYISLSQIGNIRDKITSVVPWGWNKALANILLRIGVPHHLVKTGQELEWLLQLSGRALTHDFNLFIDSDYVPRIANDVVTVENLCRQTDKPLLLKMPWSSSGKGLRLLNPPVLTHPDKIWLTRCLQRFGYVTIENFINDKVLDFATEWQIKNSEVLFEGYSIFNCDNGRYSYNEAASQDLLTSKIQSFTSDSIEDWRLRQSEAIAHFIAPFYDGPLGIDMMITASGRVIPCVEINLRHTMGYAAIKWNLLHPDKLTFSLFDILK